MYRCRSAIVPVVGMLAVALACASAAAEPPAATPDRQKDLQVFQKSLGAYRIHVGDRQATLKQEPLLRWNKPATGTGDAALFVWMLDGRPAAASTYLRNKFKGEFHEFTSLALGPLTAHLDSQQVWTPTEAGLTFAALPNAPRPDATASRRLSQLKSMARRFRGETTRRIPLDAPVSAAQLRLLPQPLLRYSDTERPELEGAIFAFCDGVDPELLLLLENRAADDETVWEFALAPVAGCALTVWLDDKQVWSMEQRYPSMDPQQTYFVSRPQTPGLEIE